MSRPAGWAARPSAGSTIIAAPSRSRRADCASGDTDRSKLLSILSKLAADGAQVQFTTRDDENRIVLAEPDEHQPSHRFWHSRPRPRCPPPAVNPCRIGCRSIRGVRDGYAFGDGRSVGSDGRDTAAGCDRSAEIEP